MVLADGLYYGATKLNASILIDAATLTGTMLTALGQTYSGIYATSCKIWHQFEDAAKLRMKKYEECLCMKILIKQIKNHWLLI